MITPQKIAHTGTALRVQWVQTAPQTIPLSPHLTSVPSVGPSTVIRDWYGM